MKVVARFHWKGSSDTDINAYLFMNLWHLKEGTYVEEDIALISVFWFEIASTLDLKGVCSNDPGGWGSRFLDNDIGHSRNWPVKRESG